jgi:acyl-CoA dehydrogenase
MDMMDFQISEKMQVILEMMNEFVDKELIPLEPEFLNREFVDLLPVLQEKRQMVRKMELWAPNHPKELGGMGLDLVEHGLVSEVLGRTPIGHYVFNCQAPDAGNIEILHKYGTPSQKEQYLGPLVDGRIRSCFSMTEVDMPGSNPVMMETTAVKEGGDYVINGQKWYTTSADGAAFAIVMAVTNPEASPYLKASMIIVPTDTPGFNRVRNIPVMGHRGTDYASHAEILYQNCRVPRQICWARRARVCHRPGPPGAWPHPSLHALDRHCPAFLRPHVPAGQHPQDLSGRKDIGIEADHPGLDRGVRCRHSGGPADDPARRLEDREGGSRSRPP